MRTRHFSKASPVLAVALGIGLAACVGGTANRQTLDGVSGPQSTAPAQAKDQAKDRARITPWFDTSEIQRVVREYILNNPEIVMQAVQLSRVRQIDRDQTLQHAAIVARADQLLRDPATPSRGNPDGDVTVIEFFDYQCGFCRRAHPVMDQLMKDDPNVRIVYKDIPILGEGSFVAARAALAAKKQGVYFKFHDLFYLTRGSLTKDRMLQIAEDFDLDVEQFEADMASPEIQDLVARNKSLAQGLKINGTPTFIIGDRLIAGFIELPLMKQAIAEARDQKVAEK